MLDWSYGLLGAVERIVLERLSVFVGPFSIDAALAVAADDMLDSEAVVSALFSLTAKSLIAPKLSPDGSIYRLLEMTRAYAREKLRLRGRKPSTSPPPAMPVSFWPNWRRSRARRRA
jgi:predicted ATPase